MEYSITFVQILVRGVYYIAPILLTLCAIIVVLGLWVGRFESWKKFDAIYWAFITALTVGYGDIRPTHNGSKILSIIIAIIGLMFAGILVATTVEAASRAFETHIKPEVMERTLP